MLSGGGLLAARDYMKRRLRSTEDRYMSIYGKKEWQASNMDLSIHCDAEQDDTLKQAFRKRLEVGLSEDPETFRLFREEADFRGERVEFRERPKVNVDELCEPRLGVHFDMEQVGAIRVIWNHMQTDGVGMWNALRTLFDPNPPLVPYRGVPAPPPFLPELLALPATARRLAWRGKLRKGAPSAELNRGLEIWEASPIRSFKAKAGGGSFNLLTSALVVAAVFARHPDRRRLTVGLTAYFPFLQGRNKYGVLLCKVRRGSLEFIVRQLKKQTRNPMVSWGTAAAQSYALGRMPDPAFIRLVSYYRRQVDVLVSSLPVGRDPVSLAGVPTVISCHPWELTLPYYFLLVGTRHQLHVSYTSRYPQDRSFLELGALLE
jgi:hypothetical protein